MKILFVDDDIDLLWIMKKILSDAGHKPVEARTVNEGIRKLKKTKNLDMAIVDLKLGNESGLTFIKKAIAIDSNMCFVMISAHGTPEIKWEAKRLGVSAFLDKPVRMEVLLDEIGKAGLKDKTKSDIKGPGESLETIQSGLNHEIAGQSSGNVAKDLYIKCL